MKTIRPIESILEMPETHDDFVDAIVGHLEREIQALGSLKGLFIKKTYAAIQSVRPGYVRHIINVLSKDYIREFAGMHKSFRDEQTLPSDRVKPFLDYVKSHQKEADEHFWRIADDYAAKRSASMIGKAYKATRPTIASHLPEIFKIICAEIDHHTTEEA